jgi:hypothetical protein
MAVRKQAARPIYYVASLGVAWVIMGSSGYCKWALQSSNRPSGCSADGWVTCRHSLRHSRSTLRSTYNFQVSTGTRPFRIILILSPERSLEDIELSIGGVIVTGFYDLSITSVRSWAVFPQPLSFLRRIRSLHWSRFSSAPKVDSLKGRILYPLTTYIVIDLKLGLIRNDALCTLAF